MKALLEDGAGGLALATVKEPTLRPGEALLAVEAAGVNRADLSQLAGRYPPPAGESSIIGLEAAGRVVAFAPGAERLTTLKVGDAACALLAGGGYAQRVAVPAELLLPLPAGWSMTQAAAFPEAAFTAYLNLFLEAELREGETLLIHGGASGVGTAAITQAKLAGARVVTTAGGADKVAVCRRLGADVALDRYDGPWRDAVRREVGEVDVILDMVGASYFQANMEVLATGGRLVSIATLGGRQVELDLLQLMGKRARLIGSTLRARPVPEKVRLQQALRARFGQAMGDGQLKPLIDTVYPWQDVNEAHARMRANRTSGKLVLQVEGTDAALSGGG